MPNPLMMLITLYAALPVLIGYFLHPKTIKSWRNLGRVASNLLKQLYGHKNLLNKRYLISITLHLYTHVKTANALERISLLFLSTLAVLYMVMGLEQIGVTTSRSIRLVLIGLMLVMPITFVLIKFELIPRVRQHYSYIKWILGGLTLLATYLLGIFSDWIIVGYTHSRADSLPSAQKALTFIFTIASWCGLAVLIGSVAYILQAINLVRLFIAEQVTDSKWWKEFRYELSPSVNLRQFPAERKIVKMKHELMLFLALFFLTVIPLTIFSSYLESDSLERDVQEIIVTTSFHSDTEACGLPWDDRVSIAVLPMGKMVAATKITGGTYIFEPGECKPTLFKTRKKADFRIYTTSLNSASLD